jgi:TolB protein
MKRVLLLLLLWGWHLTASAALTIEITEGAEGALPIAVVPFGGNAPEDVAAIVASDLKRTGRFKPLPAADMLARPHSKAEVDFRDWRALKQESLVVGQVSPAGSGGYQIQFELFDVFRGEQLAGYQFTTTARDLRPTAHHIADLIYEALTGERGAFATRIAYITGVRSGDGKERVALQVADSDGFNPQTIFSSTEPVLSPSWSPDGRRLAYVSFENRKPAIYIQEVYSGQREKVADFPGINGAPAWSPDGRELALTLSKDGNPDIYVMDLGSRSLRAITRHPAIDTEPSWSPDGGSLVFTSDRGGAPQIYRVSAGGGEPQRVTFEGSYNAKASYSPDGKLLTMVSREGGEFRIGVLDLASKAFRTVSDGNLDESPSFAPNSSMLIYAARAGGRGVLYAVSADGRTRQRLALDIGDVREPVWSPYSRR